MDKETAVTEAVDSCIRDGIMSDILTAHKAEAIGMLFRDYDEEGVKKVIYEDGLAEGIEKGRAEGLAEGKAEGALRMIKGGVPKKQALQYADITEEELASYTDRDR